MSSASPPDIGRFFLALKTGDAEVVAEMLSGPSGHAYALASEPGGWRGATGLQWAAYFGDADTCRRLGMLGALPEAADREGMTALHLAAAEGHREATVAVLEMLHDRPEEAQSLVRKITSGTLTSPQELARQGGHHSIAALIDTVLTSPCIQKEDDIPDREAVLLQKVAEARIEPKLHVISEHLSCTLYLKSRRPIWRTDDGSLELRRNVVTQRWEVVGVPAGEVYLEGGASEGEKDPTAVEEWRIGPGGAVVGGVTVTAEDGSYAAVTAGRFRNVPHETDPSALQVRLQHQQTGVTFTAPPGKTFEFDLADSPNLLVSVVVPGLWEKFFGSALIDLSAEEAGGWVTLSGGSGVSVYLAVSLHPCPRRPAASFRPLPPDPLITLQLVVHSVVDLSLPGCSFSSSELQPYVVVTYGNAAGMKEVRTELAEGPGAPSWRHSFELRVSDQSRVTLTVKTRAGAVLGSCLLPLGSKGDEDLCLDKGGFLRVVWARGTAGASAPSPSLPETSGGIVWCADHNDVASYSMGVPSPFSSPEPPPARHNRGARAASVSPVSSDLTSPASSVVEVVTRRHRHPKRKARGLPVSIRGPRFNI